MCDIWCTCWPTPKQLIAWIFLQPILQRICWCVRFFIWTAFLLTVYFFKKGLRVQGDDKPCRWISGRYELLRSPVRVVINKNFLTILITILQYIWKTSFKQETSRGSCIKSVTWCKYEDKKLSCLRRQRLIIWTAFEGTHQVQFQTRWRYTT